ncbi:MAG: hypothetical protein CV088_15325 [Nitrospira sp. LK70]|nr:hypothetical protein [Nitrospira sp. LK70]
MAMNNSEEPDAFSQGFHDIPDDRTLRSMSFIKLAELLSSCERGTTKYIVVDREVFRRKSRDQMWSTLLGAVIGGACTLAGAYIAVRYLPAQTVEVHCENTSQSMEEILNTSVTKRPPQMTVSPPENPVRQPLKETRNAEVIDSKSTKQ